MYDRHVDVGLQEAAIGGGRLDRGLRAEAIWEFNSADSAGGVEFAAA